MPLSLKKQNNPAPVKPAAAKVWTISADDGDELMDEDALLAPADLQVQVTVDTLFSFHLSNTTTDCSRNHVQLLQHQAIVRFRRGARHARTALAVVRKQKARMQTTAHRRLPPTRPQPVAA